MSNSTSIRENIAAIRAQIDAAARETGRTGADITLQTENPAVAALYCEQVCAVCGVDRLTVQEYPGKREYCIVRVPVADCRRVLLASFQ